MSSQNTARDKEAGCEPEKVEKNLQHAGGPGPELGGVDPNADKELMRLSEGY